MSIYVYRYLFTVGKRIYVLYREVHVKRIKAWLNNLCRITLSYL